MEIDNPLNYHDDAVYLFKFSEESMVPLGGFIQIDFPADIQFVEDTTLKTELCATTTCTLVGDRSIKVQTTQKRDKQTPV